jgi:hypothetical protein
MCAGYPFLRAMEIVRAQGHNLLCASLEIVRAQGRPF